MSAPAQAILHREEGFEIGRDFRAVALIADGAGEALALGSDGDFATSPLVVRRWTEARPVRTRSAAGSPLGTVRSMSVLRTRDGGVEVIWLEDALTGPGQRVVWTRGVRAGAGDGGA